MKINIEVTQNLRAIRFKKAKRLVKREKIKKSKNYNLDEIENQKDLLLKSLKGAGKIGILKIRR